MSITTLIESPARIRFTQPGSEQFYATLARRVRRYLAISGRSRLADFTIYRKAVLYAAVGVVAYVALLSVADTPLATFGLGLVYAMATLLLAINIGHDAAHTAVTGSRLCDRIILRLTFLPLGVDPYLWQMRHIRSHHAFPNVDGCDIDIDSNFFLRLSPNHPRRAHQRLQHLYAPFVFWLVGLHTAFVQDVHYLCKKRLANMTNIKHPPYVIVLFAASKIGYVTLTFALPIMFLPFPAWQVVLGSILATFMTSMTFVYMLIGTHFAEETEFPELRGDGRLPYDWAEHALRTSIDWSPQRRLAYIIAGGANAHAAHHLFPNVSHARYRAISRIIRRTTKEFKITYHSTTLLSLIRSHFRFLKRMAEEADGSHAIPRIAATA